MKRSAEVESDIEVLAAEAVSGLRKFLNLPEHTDKDLERVRVAQSIFASWTRLRQSSAHEQGNLVMLARSLAKDKSEFRRLVRLAMPNAPMLRALPAPSGK